MQSIRVEKQEAAELLDAATHAALDEAEAAIERGEVISLEQSMKNARERHQAWKKTQQATTLPAS